MAVKNAHILSWLILAVGVAMALGVAYWGWTSFAPQATQSRVPAVSQEPSALIAAPDAASLDMASGAIVGRWASAERRSYLALSNGQYEVILFADEEGMKRLYSRGAYIYDAAGGLLALTPDPRMGEPPVRGKETYSVLTMDPYRISVSGDSEGHMIWLPFGREGQRDQYHPLFTYQSSGKEPVIWRRQ